MLDQLQRPELATSGLDMGKGECGGTQVSASMNTCGMKYSGSTQWLQLYLLLASGKWQNLLGLSTEQFSVNPSLPLSGCCQQLLLFFHVPTWLYILQLCWSGLVKLVAHPLLFLARGTLPSWAAPSWGWTMPALGMGWCWQNEVVFLLVRLLSNFFVPLCC